MEGPTPVSALIHAATMVTAGIFLLMRISFLFELSPSSRSVVVILGAFTALYSAFTAVFLYDIKKIIAYSTCSQLGYMLVACGLSQYSLSLFHLINHAFFKALLFLTAGAIIHSFNNEQDIRKLSAIKHRSPFLFTAMLVGNIAIMGLPFLSGFYSKDLIIELTYLSPQNF
jgi:NADH-ubiquinone oxidoreductase chain 5